MNRYRKLNTCFITKSGLAKEYLNSKGLSNVHSVGVGLSTSFLHNITNEELPELAPIKEMNCLKLLYVGVIEPRRNSLFMLDILNELKIKGVNYKLIMIGRYKNETYKNVFNARVHELGLSDNIYYIPRVEQKFLSKVYANTDIFLLPTIYDIYGMVLLESMYFGMPTITSVNGGSNMMIEDGTNGFIISKFEAKVWAEKVIELSNDKAYCKRIGDAAHKTIVEKFTWDKLATQFINIYEQKLKEG